MTFVFLTIKFKPDTTKEEWEAWIKHLTSEYEKAHPNLVLDVNHFNIVNPKIWETVTKMFQKMDVLKDRKEKQKIVKWMTKNFNKKEIKEKDEKK